MKIDLHCHTKKVKSGDASTRNVNVKTFMEKIQAADVKIVAITNHNHFDLEQYLEFKAAVSADCDIWPGVELDIQGKTNRGHLLVIANPQNAVKFCEAVDLLLNNSNPDNFIAPVKKVHDYLDICDVFYIPHFHKEPKLSELDIEELNDLLTDKTRLFKETSDYRSLGVFSNFDYSMIIGSDNQDWNCYEKSKFADIRLPVQTFEQFCLLAKKDKQIIDTLLNKKRSTKITVSPHRSVRFQVPIYEDVNVIFGQKGTGKSEIIKSLREYYDEKSILNKIYIGNEKESDFGKLLDTSDMKREVSKLGIASFSDEFKEINVWQDEMPVALESYIKWISTKDNNQNKSKMKITNAVKLEVEKTDNKIEKDYKTVVSVYDAGIEGVDFNKYLSQEEVPVFKELFNKICSEINIARTKKWETQQSTKLTNWSIDKIKSIADKCSDTVSKPSTTGFSEFANNRIRLYEILDIILTAFESEEKIETEHLGIIEEKGEILIRSKYRLLCSQSRANEFNLKISKLKEFKKNLEGLSEGFAAEGLFPLLSKYKELYEDGIKDISSFIGISKDTVLCDGESYQPSSGERGILLLQRLLDADSDVYLLDEPELGMGNSYINASVVPQIISIAKGKKVVIVATHNANIAVRTLPYMSIFRAHRNGEYATFLGNPFSDELINLYDEGDIRNWTQESMHTLEGGRDAFYERKDIYESGRKNY